MAPNDYSDEEDDLEEDVEEEEEEEEEVVVAPKRKTKKWKVNRGFHMGLFSIESTSMGSEMSHMLICQLLYVHRIQPVRSAPCLPSSCTLRATARELRRKTPRLASVKW